MKYKNTFTSFAVLIGVVTQATAQVVLTSSRFPVENEVQLYHLSSNLSIEQGESGPTSQVWDFSNLSAQEVLVDSFLAPAEGEAFASFPTATILWRQEDGREVYLQINNSSVHSLGYVQEVFGQDFPVSYNQPQTIAIAPTAFGDSFSTSNESSFAVSIADYPAIDSLLATLDLGELSGTLDSLRLRTTVTNQQEADAWGICLLPLNSYEVLRVVETTTVSSVLEVYVAFGPFSFWLDLGGFVDELSLSPLSTGQVYHYLSPDYKTPITQVRTSPEGVILTINYLNEEAITGIVTPATKMPEVLIYPNPAKGTVFLALPDAEGMHDLLFYTPQGQLKEIVSVYLRGGTGRLDLSGSSAGLYFFQIQKGGSPRGSGRVVVNN